jgi:hypothetical protein
LVLATDTLEGVAMPSVVPDGGDELPPPHAESSKAQAITLTNIFDAGKD